MNRPTYSRQAGTIASGSWPSSSVAQNGAHQNWPVSGTSADRKPAGEAAADSSAGAPARRERLTTGP
ncbi:hypothetical protein EDD27_2689 [Nonomuraea polychroma]|uniref:Uncharacterized protein n=1 Tax=Nonomuraea polychroma TaxID=46176 RepID=A0A438M373_9ACTN|nr:hypothetical protein EDD27_2689 [Nonomuraea polychroma]